MYSTAKACMMLLLLLVVSGAKAMRKKVRRASAAPALSIEVYSFGAPKISGPPLALPGGGCIPGLRLETENFRRWGMNTRDLVPWLSTTLNFPLMSTMILGRNGKTDTHDCGWKRGMWNTTLTSLTLHDANTYRERAAGVSSTLNSISTVGLVHSYNTDSLYVARDVERRGWGLVNSALVNQTEVIHLMQKPETLECILTFEGSDTQEDWKNDADYRRTTLCGFEGVHAGYAREFRAMVEGPEWSEGIKPYLGRCKKVQVVGHSLGGVLATFLAACALRAPENDATYEALRWTQEGPALMPFIPR